MEQYELMDLAKQLTKVKNAKKPYYFFFVLEGFDEKPALYVERKPSDARRKGMVAKGRARKKQVAHGRVELRSRRAVFVNETSMNGKKIMKAFKYELCKERELRSVAPVLKKADVVSVEEDLALTMEAASTPDPSIKKLASAKAKKKGQKHRAKELDTEEQKEKEMARWQKLQALVNRRVRILERKSERLRPTETVPVAVILDLRKRIQKLREATEQGESEYTNGHPKIAIRSLVNVRDTAHHIREELDDLPSEASSDSVDMELGWVKILHQAWTRMLETYVIDLNLPLTRLCVPLTHTLDQLLMSSTIEELHTHRQLAIKAAAQVNKDIKSCSFLADLEALPEQPLTARAGLFPTLERITASLEA